MNLYSIPTTTALATPCLDGLAMDAAGKAVPTTPEKLGKACREFEAMFLRKILEQGRQPMFKPKDAPGNSSNANYQDMVNFHLAASISQTGAFGLASSLQSQLDRQLALKSPADADAATALRPPAFSPLHD